MKAKEVQTNRMYYHAISTPLGDICVMGDENLVREILFFHAISSLPITSNMKNGHTPAMDSAVNYLNLYFNAPHELKHMELMLIFPGAPVIPARQSDTHILLDMSPFTGKEITIYRELMNTGIGSTISYRTLAQTAGFPRASRFAGNAMAKNRFPILIPCHRVIKSDGALGNYTGGRDIKEFLLDYEMQIPFNG